MFFFLKNPQGFWTFEKSSSKLTSNGPIWLEQIYRDMKFILRGHPERCDEILRYWGTRFPGCRTLCHPGQYWSAALLSVGLRQGWDRVLISIDHRSALIRVNQIDQQCWEWISVGLRQGSAGEAKLPKLSRVSFACKQASDIIWKIYFHKDRKASMKNFLPWERC